MYTLSLAVLCAAALVSAGPDPGAKEPSESGDIYSMYDGKYGYYTSGAGGKYFGGGFDDITLDDRDFIDYGLDLILGNKCLKAGGHICGGRPTSDKVLFVIALVVVTNVILITLMCFCYCCCRCASTRGVVISVPI